MADLGKFCCRLPRSFSCFRDYPMMPDQKPT
jgi:hypothetical protein